MSIADDITDDLAELLDDPDYGRAVTLRRRTPGTYDPSTGATGAETVTSNLTRAIILGYRDSLINGTLIKQGDRKAILKRKGMTMTPQEADELVVGSDVYSVVSHKTGELGGTNYLYVLQIRK